MQYIVYGFAFLLTWATIALVLAAIYTMVFHLGRRAFWLTLLVVFLDLVAFGAWKLYSRYAGPGRKVFWWDRRSLPFRRRDAER